MSGGYDEGYLACPCFWGTSPGSLIGRLEEQVGEFTGLHVLDAGCGEGKNAIHLARKGASVRAIDISEVAITNARSAWPDSDLVDWQVADIQAVEFSDSYYDIVIAYGLLHCLAGQEQVASAILTLQRATKRHGINVVCAFNDRSQDLSAHPNFHPCLLPHRFYLEAYAGWTINFAGDSDLHEIHPHNKIPHVHSMTRILACR